MASISIKQKVLEAVQQLTPDATVEDAFEARAAADAERRRQHQPRCLPRH